MRFKTHGLLETSVEPPLRKEGFRNVNNKGKQVLGSRLFSDAFRVKIHCKIWVLPHHQGGKIHDINRPTLLAVRGLAAAEFVLGPVIKSRLVQRQIKVKII